MPPYKGTTIGELAARHRRATPLVRRAAVARVARPISMSDPVRQALVAALIGAVLEELLGRGARARRGTTDTVDAARPAQDQRVREWPA